MAFDGIPLKAGGDVNPSRFVTIDTTKNQTVVESNSGDAKIIGVSQEGTKYAPGTNSSTLAAEDGDNLHVHFPGEVCLVQMDAVGCTAGDYLKPDNSGMGVVASSTNVVGAMALETAAANEKVLAVVLPPGTKAP